VIFAARPGERSAVASPGLDSFRVARFTFTLEAKETLCLPPYKGSVLRGGFGHVFRKVGCIARRDECPPCLLKGACPYSYIFETPPPPTSQVLRKYPHAPHPFILEPPYDGTTTYEPGTSLSFGLVLVGKAIDYLPYFIYAFEELGRIGLGRGKGKYCLVQVVLVRDPDQFVSIYDGRTGLLTASTDLATPVLPDGSVIASEAKQSLVLPSTITLRFLSPTRLQYNGHPAGPGEFHILLRNLLRRINVLNYFHCGGLLLDNARNMIESARSIETVEARVRWHAWERYSNRQGQRVPMGGFTGRVTYRGALSPFWPWLRLGEQVHVGKAATFGLGHYRIVPFLEESTPAPRQRTQRSGVRETISVRGAGEEWCGV
jgi:hypothetical protein